MRKKKHLKKKVIKSVWEEKEEWRQKKGKRKLFNAYI